MKIEKRGKYPGVKIHFDKEQVEGALKEIAAHQKLFEGASDAIKQGRRFKEAFPVLRELFKSIENLLEEDPTVLEERTEEEIKAELELEFRAAGEKLEALSKGKDWKEAKEYKKSIPQHQPSWTPLAHKK